MYHHERYDGKGYPYGLKGDEIPYVARIIGIADAYDAITSNRIYEKAQMNDYAINELKKGSGTQFDPYLIEVMLELLQEGFQLPENPQFEFEQDNTQEDEHDAFIVEVCKKTENDAHKSSDYDYLTDFPIRKIFEIKVNDYLDNPLEQGTMFLMDLDNFMYVNVPDGQLFDRPTSFGILGGLEATPLRESGGYETTNEVFTVYEVE
jgi:predicted signal transduction protein with EAL and GGDEF domain